MKRKQVDEGEEAAGPHKLNKGELYKPPTNDELHQLKEAETLFQSSLFRLQVTELLKEVYVKQSRQKQVDAYFAQLKPVLLGLPAGERFKICNQDWFKKNNVEVPIVQTPFQVKGSFQFLPPKSVKVVGSYKEGISLKPHPHVDVALEIPKECIEPKDYLNQRYLRKRALYLAAVAHHLRGQSCVGEVSFSFLQANQQKPVLIVTPSGKLGNHVKIRIHTMVDQDALKASRFDIRKNNIRSEWFHGETVSSDATVQPATPVYNTNVLVDLCMSSHTDYMHEMIDGAQSIRDGISLLKVWLHQRELHTAGFTGFIMSMYVTYLVSRHKLSAMMSSYQIMRNTLLHFVKEDWTVRGISLLTSPSIECPSMSDFHAAFPVVFVDNTGLVNFCSAMRTDVFEQAQHEAQLSLQILREPGVDSFKLLFMTPVPFTRQFDHYLHITKPTVFKQCIEKFALKDQLMDHCGDDISASLPGVLQLLLKALDTRVKMLAVGPAEMVEWPVNKKPPIRKEQVTIGIRLDLEYANKVLTKGPPADSQEAAEFQQFWGPKSELRRFQDGNICEAVVWSGDTMSARRVVIGQIVKHILNRHAGIPSDCVRYSGDELDSLLSLHHTTKSKYGTGEEESSKLQASFDSLAKHLRALDDLPLSFVTLQGTSPVFRHAEVFPDLPALKVTNAPDSNLLLPSVEKPCHGYTGCNKVICTLEGSGKWPDDVDAIQRLKAAMLIKVALLLAEKHSLLTRVLPSCLLVLKDGFVFTLHLSYPREIAILKEVRSPEGQVQVRETEESLALEVETVMLPKLSTALNGIQQGNNTFSSVVRLAKRWISSQLLWHYISEEAIELLVAHLYVCSLPFSQPRSPIIGFLRFLNLLATHDWLLSPVVVNFNQELKQDEIVGIRQKFTKERNSLPAMVIASPYDKHQSVWTKAGPDVIILQRLITLAKESEQALHKQIFKNSPSNDYKLIFRPPLDQYDVIIRLRHKHAPRHYQSIDCSPNYIHPCLQDSKSKGESAVIPTVDFDPVQRYLQELKTSFSEIALFFHDVYGGDVIAVLWKPHLNTPQPFKVMTLSQRMVRTTQADVQSVANFDAYLEDFRILGQGLVDKVEPNINISQTPS